MYIIGETVEENANLVVRLLIRRPECLGPALRGGSKTLKQSLANNTGSDPNETSPGGPESGADNGSPQQQSSTSPETPIAQVPSSAGGGLLKAMREGLIMSAQIKLVKMAQEAEANGLSPEDENLGWRTALLDYEDANLFTPLPYNFENLPVNY